MLRRITLAVLVTGLAVAIGVWVSVSNREGSDSRATSDPISLAEVSAETQAIREQAEAALAANPQLTALVLEQHRDILVVRRDDGGIGAPVLAAVALGTTVAGLLLASRIRQRRQQPGGDHHPEHP